MVYGKLKIHVFLFIFCMIAFYLLITSGLLTLIRSSPVPSASENRQHWNTNQKSQRRSVGHRNVYSGENFEFWTENVLSVIFPPVLPEWKPLKSPYEDKGYYYVYNNNRIDPYLITGPQGRQAASYLYSKELFFHEIPHLRAVLRNQELRKQNGLAGHLLSSIRVNSDFPTVRKQSRL